MTIGQLRQAYHRQVCAQIIRVQKKGDLEYPNFADGSNKTSREISWGVVNQLGYTPNRNGISDHTMGKQFEEITKGFIQGAFDLLQHLRPGKWFYSVRPRFSEFEQYEHLAYLEEIIRGDQKLESALRGGYIITPDIVVGRYPVADDEINLKGAIIDEQDQSAALTPLRRSNRSKGRQILHASVSCKWTIRSDRAQNTRTEALNLIRNRKGPLPHVAAVTAEPTPHRLASLALGTGDLDCVYHFALYELVQSIEELENEDALAEVQMMIDGRRLRDISDLPFDLAI